MKMQIHRIFQHTERDKHYCLETFCHLVGTGTSVKAPSITAFCRRTNATKGASKKSTSPTSTFDASASLGNFFMNLFLSFGNSHGRRS